MKPYVLYTKSKKKASRVQMESELDASFYAKMHPAEEALLDFNPDENEIDGKLYDGIVEIDTLPARDRQFSAEEIDKLIE